MGRQNYQSSKLKLTKNLSEHGNGSTFKYHYTVLKCTHFASWTGLAAVYVNVVVCTYLLNSNKALDSVETDWILVDGL